MHWTTDIAADSIIVNNKDVNLITTYIVCSCHRFLEARHDTINELSFVRLRYSTSTPPPHDFLINPVVGPFQKSLYVKFRRDFFTCNIVTVNTKVLVISPPIFL